MLVPVSCRTFAARRSPRDDTGPLPDSEPRLFVRNRRQRSERSCRPMCGRDLVPCRTRVEVGRQQPTPLIQRNQPTWGDSRSRFASRTCVDAPSREKRRKCVLGGRRTPLSLCRCKCRSTPATRTLPGPVLVVRPKRRLRPWRERSYVPARCLDLPRRHARLARAPARLGETGIRPLALVARRYELPAHPQPRRLPGKKPQARLRAWSLRRSRKTPDRREFYALRMADPIASTILLVGFFMSWNSLVVARSVMPSR